MNRQTRAPLLFQLADDLKKKTLLLHHVPAMIRGLLIRRIGHQRHLVRPDLLNELNEIRRRVSFDIELDTSRQLRCDQRLASAGTSLRRMWRSSGRGCTVRPWAPAATTMRAASSTEG